VSREQTATGAAPSKETPSKETPSKDTPSMTSSMSRRDALGASAGLVVGAALEATLAGCRADAPSANASEPAATAAAPTPRAPAEPGKFTLEQRALVDELTEYLIPETSSPGARRAEVAAYIEGVVFAVLDEEDRQAFCAGLDAIDASARQKHGRAFWSCGAEARSKLVRAFFAADAKGAPSGGGHAGSPGAAAVAATNELERAFRERLRELTITGFCKSRLGATRVLQYDPIPGAYDGCRSLESVGRAWATS